MTNSRAESGCEYTFPCAAMAPQSCHSAPMETHTFDFRLQANALEGPTTISYQLGQSALAASDFMTAYLS
jgi:hypothetical protein